MPRAPATRRTEMHGPGAVGAALHDVPSSCGWRAGTQPGQQAAAATAPCEDLGEVTGSLSLPGVGRKGRGTSASSLWVVPRKLPQDLWAPGPSGPLLRFSKTGPCLGGYRLQLCTTHWSLSAQCPASLSPGGLHSTYKEARSTQWSRESPSGR